MNHGTNWMKRGCGLLLFAILLLSACTIQQYDTCDLNSDGTVQDVERARCEAQQPYVPTSNRTYPLYFSVMSHYEVTFTDDTNDAVFNKHVSDLNWALDLFDDYDAKLTIETEKPFARAVLNSGSTILSDALARGHGVGTHCDIGTSTGTTVESLAADYKENKELVDEIVGEENNRGCSGGFGPADYVLAASSAGFGYLDGVVYYAYLAQPQSIRPDQVSDEEIRNIYFHDPVIPNFSDHIYPRFLNDAQDFVEDADGTFVLLNGELGEIANLEEGRSNCPCTLTDADFDVVYDAIDEANAVRDPKRVAHIYIHMAPGNFKPENEALLRSFLEHMQQLQADGKIQWATMGEVYDAKLSERV